MLLKHQVLAIILIFFICFYFLRGFLSGMKWYQLNKSALKKKKKGETFVQWLLYLKFKEEIPFGWRLFYYLVCTLHFFCIFVCIVLRLVSMEVSLHIGRKVVVGLLHFDAVWNFVIYFAFHSRDPLNRVKYERWIKKKKGMPPKKK